jgi:ferritin-like metal-binding protein YciE
MSRLTGNLNEKFTEHLNELLSIENAAQVHLQDRIRETPMEDVRKRLGSHLEETNEHQRRLQQIIRNLGGTPTESKGHLPNLTPSLSTLATKTVKDTVKETVKSITEAATGDSSSDESLPSEEMELMKTKNDMLVEDAEVLSYKLMIKTAERFGMKDDAIISPLKQTLQEEERMAQWLIDNSPSILDYHWSKIEASLTGKSEEEVRRERSSTAATTP